MGNEGKKEQDLNNELWNITKKEYFDDFFLLQLTQFIKCFHVEYFKNECIKIELLRNKFHITDISYFNIFANIVSRKLF